jgi:thymidylate synthase
MNHYKAHNYQMIAARVYRDLLEHGVPMSSRNGPVLRLPGVTVFEIDHPWERVNAAPVRDANPFFHLMETAAMLGGHNSVRFLSFFAKNMASYSDDGETYNAFYGTRLHMGRHDNQLAKCALLLRDNPDDRQAVAQIWDEADLGKSTKDKACNLLLMFSVQDGKLCMTSVNRSNDSVWGIVTGANVVHLSYFQQYVAEVAGYPVGTWTHITNNLHAYTDNPQWARLQEAATCPDRAFCAEEGSILEGYVYLPALSLTEHMLKTNVSDAARDLRLIYRPDAYGRAQFHEALRRFLRFADDTIAKIEKNKAVGEMHLILAEAAVLSRGNPWIDDTVLPVFLAWAARKAEWPEDMVQGFVKEIAAPDWRMACTSWLDRHGYSIKKGAHSNEQ